MQGYCHKDDSRIQKLAFLSHNILYPFHIHKYNPEPSPISVDRTSVQNARYDKYLDKAMGACENKIFPENNPEVEMRSKIKSCHNILYQETYEQEGK